VNEMTTTIEPGGDTLRGDREQIVAMNLALIAAQRSIRVIAKDGYNNYSKFSYTKADSLIRECADVLHANGLAVIPGSSVAHDVAGMPYLRLFLEIIHEGGASRVGSRDWPIEASKGQNMVRAAAVTETSSLSYFYRTLLALKRAERDDMNHEEAPPPPRNVAPAVEMVGLKAQSVLERLSGTPKPEKVAEAGAWLSGEVEKRDAGEDIGMSDDDVARIMERLKALQTRPADGLF